MHPLIQPRESMQGFLEKGLFDYSCIRVWGRVRVWGNAPLSHYFLLRPPGKCVPNLAIQFFSTSLCFAHSNFHCSQVPSLSEHLFHVVWNVGLCACVFPFVSWHCICVGSVIYWLFLVSFCIWQMLQKIKYTPFDVVQAIGGPNLNLFRLYVWNPKFW